MHNSFGSSPVPSYEAVQFQLQYLSVEVLVSMNEPDPSGTERDKTSEKISFDISLATRYEAAWAELSQRIDSRQISYLGHATISGAIIAAYIAFSNPSLRPALPTPAFDFALVLAPALIGLAFGCWIRSHDIQIGLLGAFCAACERLTEPHQKQVPTWHCFDRPWRKASLAQRQWIEMAFVILSILQIECVSIFYWDRLDDLIVPSAISHLFLGVSCWTVLSIEQTRDRLSQTEFYGNEMWPPIQSVSPFNVLGLAAVLIGVCTLIGEILCWGCEGLLHWKSEDHRLLIVAGYTTLISAALCRLITVKLNDSIRKKLNSRSRRRKRREAKRAAETGGYRVPSKTLYDLKPASAFRLAWALIVSASAIGLFFALHPNFEQWPGSLGPVAFYALMTLGGYSATDLAHTFLRAISKDVRAVPSMRKLDINYKKRASAFKRLVIRPKRPRRRTI